MNKNILRIVAIVILATVFIGGTALLADALIPNKSDTIEKPVDLSTVTITEKEKTTEKEKITTEKASTTAKTTTTEKKATTTEKVTTTEAPTTTEAVTTEVVFEQTYTTAEPPITTTEAGAEQGEPEIRSNTDQDIVYDTGEPVEPPVGTEEVPTEETVSDDPHAGMTYLGEYWQTGYVWTGNPCADGVYPQEGYTVACNNPNLWHRWIWIDGTGARYVHDVGGMSTWEHVDIYVGTIDNIWQTPSMQVGVWLMPE